MSYCNCLWTVKCQDGTVNEIIEVNTHARDSTMFTVHPRVKLPPSHREDLQCLLPLRTSASATWAFEEVFKAPLPIGP